MHASVFLFRFISVWVGTLLPVNFPLQKACFSIIISKCVTNGFSGSRTDYLRGLKQQMSASREKKTRQATPGVDWTDPKTAREAQQRKAEKRSNMIYAAIAVAFVIVAVVSLTWKSQIIQKRATAVTIGDEKYTAGEVNYYFQQVYQNFLSQNSYFISYLGLDTTQDLRDQAYPGSEDGQTWFDYFLDQTLQQMTTVKALNDDAAANGFTWTDELQSELDSSMQTLKDNVSSSGYYTSFDQYLTMNYGSLMTESIFTEQLKETMLAQAYATEYSDGLSYTLDDLTAAYNENPNSYDKVAYQSVRISGSVPTTDADGNTVEVTDEMKADAMAQAKEKADTMYASFQAGQSLESLSEADEDTYYTDSTGVTYFSDALGEWLFDSSRKPGDSAVVEDEAGSAYYVVSFGSRFRDEYDTVNVRHILFTIDDSALDTESETYESDLQTLKDETMAKAEDMLAQWKDGEATEDSFAALANEYSEDPGSNTTGGLYSQVAKGQMVTEFNDWCFDPARQPGDTGIVYGESDSYKGYHVMYFVGTDLPYWQVQVTDTLKNNDVSAWYAEKTADYTAEQGSGIRYVG